MEIQYRELDNGIILIKLIGRLDIIGTGEIETKFTGYCAGEKVRVIVELSEVGLPGLHRHSAFHTDRQVGRQPRREDGNSEPNLRNTRCAGNNRHPGNYPDLLSS
jgi:hypothetical protein